MRPVGIGDTETREDVAFEPFHGIGLGISLVIVAHEMQKAMHREMGEMMEERLVFLGASRATVS